MKLTPAQRRKVYLAAASKIEDEVTDELADIITYEEWTPTPHHFSRAWWFCCAELQDAVRELFEEQFSSDDDWDATNLTGNFEQALVNMHALFPEFYLFKPRKLIGNEQWWSQRYCDQETRVAVLRLCAEMTKGA